MTPTLQYIQMDTKPDQAPQYGVIWLHGLGADGNDFAGLAPELRLDSPVRFIFPHAPMRSVTINGGMKMRAWYDILEMSLDRKVDMANILESRQQIDELVDELVAAGVPSERIVIAGFSQGGVIAYDYALNSGRKLAAVLALSTYLAAPDALTSAANNANGATPFCIHHGTYDPVVVPELGERAQTLLQRQGYPVTYKTYPMPHAVCPAQVQDLRDWFASILI